MSSANKSSRITKVQMPGAVDPAPSAENKPDSDLPQQASSEAAKPEASAPAVAPAPAPRTGRNFRDMHAHEIDHATLTAPVMTKDGWLCPPAPEAKK